MSFNPGPLNDWTVPNCMGCCLIISAAMSARSDAVIMPTLGQELSCGVDISSQLQHGFQLPVSCTNKTEVQIIPIVGG